MIHLDFCQDSPKLHILKRTVIFMAQFHQSTPDKFELDKNQGPNSPIFLMCQIPVTEQKGCWLCKPNLQPAIFFMADRCFFY